MKFTKGVILLHRLFRNREGMKIILRPFLFSCEMLHCGLAIRRSIIQKIDQNQIFLMFIMKEIWNVFLKNSELDIKKKMISGYATCIGSMLNIDGGLLIR